MGHLPFFCDFDRDIACGALRPELCNSLGRRFDGLELQVRSPACQKQRVSAGRGSGRFG